ncbi:MAG: DNA-directed RNA polymerase subunit alpha [bacterium]
MKFKSLQMPKAVEIEAASATDTYSKFIVEPLERGFGVTIGSGMRRILLSSLQGAAVTSVKIEGALHEFSTLPHVREDVAEIIINIKKMRFKFTADEPKTLTLDVDGPREVKAGDFKGEASVEILNPETPIAVLDKGAKLYVEIEVDSGRGFVLSEMQVQAEKPLGVIPVDSNFSPVKRVNFKVENTRVGQRTDYDKLILEVWSDGSITPRDAVSYAASILKNHLGLLITKEEKAAEEEIEEVDEEWVRIHDLLQRNVEELELSVRSSNCLRTAEIKTIGDLVRKTESEMLKFRNFGRKSLKEISDILASMGLHFGTDVDYYMDKRKAESAARVKAQYG